MRLLLTSFLNTCPSTVFWGISFRVLYLSSDVYLYNASLSEGVVPTDWKNAFVTPVYKKGPKSKAENYRPISLTCICCKVLEHIITSNIMSHLDKNNLLFHNQHIFRSRVSCETQLIQFTQDLYDTLNQGGGGGGGRPM